jgi:hypothetical protein
LEALRFFCSESERRLYYLYSWEKLDSSVIATTQYPIRKRMTTPTEINPEYIYA